MTASTGNSLFEQVVHRIDPHSNLLRAWVLKGGVSAQVTALEIERPDGQPQTMIVRQHGPTDLRRNPQIAADEFKLLQLLQSADVHAPAPYIFDQSGQIFATPYIVIEYIDGQSEFAPAAGADLVVELAAQLVKIHQVAGSQHDLSFLPLQANLSAEKVRDRPAMLDESLDEGRIRDALEAIWPLPQRNASVLLHGDFWPGNILWKNGRLVGVIDWEDAALGDPLADLANSRLEVLWAFGVEAMRRFTEHYLSLSPIDAAQLPYWDLYAALRPASKLGEWAADAIAEQRMRERHGWFVTQAFETLRAQHTA